MKLTWKQILWFGTLLPSFLPPQDPSVSPHLSLSGLQVKSCCYSERDPHVTVTSSHLNLDSHLPLTLTHSHPCLSNPAPLFPSFYLIFKATHICLLVFSPLINTTCQGVTFHPTSPPSSTIPTLQHVVDTHLCLTHTCQQHWEALRVFFSVPVPPSEGVDSAGHSRQKGGGLSAFSMLTCSAWQYHCANV